MDSKIFDKILFLYGFILFIFFYDLRYLLKICKYYFG